MNKLLFGTAVLLLFGCNEAEDNGKVDTGAITNSASADGKTNEDLPEIKFEEETFDFGKITQGEKVSHSFKFSNTGKSNLIISGASGSCGCTVPEWPKEPVQPGKTGHIDVVFSSEGKSGHADKTVTVVTNCEPATRVIRIKAEIIVPETAK